jgi:hypothetical protein
VSSQKCIPPELKLIVARFVVLVGLLKPSLIHQAEKKAGTFQYAARELLLSREGLPFYTEGFLHGIAVFQVNFMVRLIYYTAH